MKAEEEQDAVNWLDQYGDALYGYAFSRVRNSFVAEDLLQETLLAAYRSRKNFAGTSTVKTWLTGILKHKIVDYYRKLKPEIGYDNFDDFPADTDQMFNDKEGWQIKPLAWSNDPQNIFQRKELMAVIHACLAEMPNRLAHAYSLRELEGATTSELCELLEIGKNNCWVLLYRARMLLRRCLELNWFDGKKQESRQ